jgi:polygalacturonase
MKLLHLFGFVLAVLFVSHVSAADASPSSDSPSPADSALLNFQPALPKIPDRVFSVANFGAKADGTSVDTAAIQSAIDAASKAGGGIVELQAGTYVSGPLQLSSRINLRLAAGATLKMLPFAQYPGGTKHPDSFISGSDLHDIAITGAGTIDGQGAPWWPLAKTKGVMRPRMIALSRCERVLIEGVTLRDSPMFHIAISGNSTEVTVRGVTIRAPASDDPVNPSHNTDACDVSGHNVLIRDCDVSVGDDNFTCGGNTSNVLIDHCTYGYGHGVSIGSYTNGGVSNIAVIDCTFTHTEAGIRIKSDRDRGGVVQHLRYENLIMTDVAFPILIYGAYMATERQYRDLNKLTPEIATQYPGQSIGARTPVFQDIVFRNITATAAKGRRAGLIWGLPEAPATDIRLENVHITADLPFGIYNAKRIQIRDCTITTPTGVTPFSTANAQIDTAPN